ncbi:hypothetical protein PXK17_20090, partial [Phaeobacter gallaeciensis]
AGLHCRYQFESCLRPDVNPFCQHGLSLQQLPKLETNTRPSSRFGMIHFPSLGLLLLGACPELSDEEGLDNPAFRFDELRPFFNSSELSPSFSFFGSPLLISQSFRFQLLHYSFAVTAAFSTVTSDIVNRLPVLKQLMDTHLHCHFSSGMPEK